MDSRYLSLQSPHSQTNHSFNPLRLRPKLYRLLFLVVFTLSLSLLLSVWYLPSVRISYFSPSPSPSQPPPLPQPSSQPSWRNTSRHEPSVVRDGIVYHPFPKVETHEMEKDMRLRPIRDHAQFSYDCLDHWVSQAKWSGPCLHDVIEESSIDLVYLWVNGSNELLARERARAQEGTSHHGLNARFREHDELRHSLRASYETTYKWRNNVWHIISADMEDPEDSNQRLGLVPQWLNTSVSWERQGGRAPIYFHHNSQIFRYGRITLGEPDYSVEDIEAWRQRALPSFNSFAIEVMMSNLDPKITSDNLITLNDDQYLVLEMPPSAFHSALYGPVIRLHNTWTIQSDATGKQGGEHEIRSLGWANHLLDVRFGARGRYYTEHNARAMSLPIMHEASVMFADFFTWTAYSRFRGQHGTPPEIEVHAIFLATHFLPERHREALLWSWIVAKWGGKDGILTREKRALMWKEMGGSDSKEVIEVQVQTGHATAEVEQQMHAAGLDPPKSKSPNTRTNTKYIWTSLDGFGVHKEGGSMQKSVRRSDCLGEEDVPAWTLFRDTIHNKRACGDLILSAVKSHTREPGLSVYLPPKSPEDIPPEESFPSDEVETLPLWLPEEAPPLPLNPRAFAVRLFHRYSHVIGESPVRFFGIENMKQGTDALKYTDNQKDISLLCINDDMSETDAEETSVLYRSWLDKRWPMPLECEVQS